MINKIIILLIIILLPTCIFGQSETVCKCDTVDFEYIYNQIRLLNKNLSVLKNSKSDETDAISKDVTDLYIQLTSLSNEVTKINSELDLNNRSIVENYIEKLETIAELSELYKELSENMIYEIGNDNRLAFIAEINNPGSDQLGFKFTDIIQNAALETVGDVEMTAVQKSNFETKLKDVVSGVYTFTSHGFAQQLASLNPATSATLTVFNFLANYYVSDYTISGFFAKTVEVEDKKLFSEKELESYLTNIEDFITYYDELSVINQEFKVKLNQLEQDFNTLDVNIESLDSIIEENNLIISQLKAKSVTNDEVFEISSIYDKTLESIKTINESLTSYIQNYNIIRDDFYTSYIEHIEKSEELLKNDLVKKANKTQALKNRETLITLCNIGKTGLSRYNDDIEEINWLFEEIW